MKPVGAHGFPVSRYVTSSFEEMLAAHFGDPGETLVAHADISARSLHGDHVLSSCLQGLRLLT
jgi:hypothetical protein